MKILWVSRHEPLKEQVSELRQVFGNVRVDQYGEIIYNVAQLLKVYDDGLYDEMVVVLPVQIISQLLLAGVKPLKPVLHRQMVGGGEVRLVHHHFERILKLEYCSEVLVGE